MGLIRVLLALAVISAHTELPIFGKILFEGCGRISVTSFFIISGFYMSLVLDEKYLALNSGIRKFYISRFFRIYPIYWLVLILSLIAMHQFGHTSMLIWSQPIGEFYQCFKQMDLWDKLILIIPNTFIVFSHIVLLHLGWNGTTGWTTARGTSDTLLGQYFLFFPPAWTLSLEVLFYSLCPFIVRRKFIFMAITLILGQPYLYSKLGVPLDLSSNISFVLTSVQFVMSNFFYFALGMFSYEIYNAMKLGKYNLHRILKPWLVKLGGYMVLIFATTLVLSSNDLLSVHRTEKIFVALIFVGIPFLFMLTKDSKIDAFLASLSYPLYISHFIVYKYVSELSNITIISYYFWLFVFSLGLVYLFEIPMHKFRQRIASNISIKIKRFGYALTARGQA